MEDDVQQGELPVAETVGVVADHAIWAQNQVELAKHLGCSRKSIRRWLEEKDPDCPGAESDGRYNVTRWKLWSAKKGKRPARKSGGDKNSLELDKLRLQNEKLEIENMVRRGQLLDCDEVCRTLEEMMGAFVTKGRGLKHSLAPKVVGVSIGEATKRIGRDFDEALTELALGDWAQKKTFWSNVFATLLGQHRKYSLGVGQSET